MGQTYMYLTFFFLDYKRYKENIGFKMYVWRRVRMEDFFWSLLLWMVSSWYTFYRGTISKFILLFSIIEKNCDEIGTFSEHWFSTESTSNCVRLAYRRVIWNIRQTLESLFSEHDANFKIFWQFYWHRKPSICYVNFFFFLSFS